MGKYRNINNTCSGNGYIFGNHSSWVCLISYRDKVGTSLFILEVYNFIIAFLTLKYIYKMISGTTSPDGYFLYDIVHICL
jgi:hypothetical protein